MRFCPIRPAQRACWREQVVGNWLQRVTTDTLNQTKKQLVLRRALDRGAGGSPVEACALTGNSSQVSAPLNPESELEDRTGSGLGISSATAFGKRVYSLVPIKGIFVLGRERLREVLSALTNCRAFTLDILFEVPSERYSCNVFLRLEWRPFR